MRRSPGISTTKRVLAGCAEVKSRHESFFIFNGWKSAFLENKFEKTKMFLGVSVLEKFIYRVKTDFWATFFDQSGRGKILLEKYLNNSQKICYNMASSEFSQYCRSPEIIQNAAILIRVTSNEHVNRFNVPLKNFLDISENLFD